MATKSKSKSKSNIAITDPDSSKEFRKTNDAIGLRVVDGSLTLLKRKVFNVMMYHAQQMRTPGINAPIKTATSDKYFWIPLSELAKDAAYDSKDTEFLKEQLEGLQDIRLLMENDKQWTSERLVSSVTLVNPEGLRNNSKNSGQVWFGFAFPPEVHELVMVPGEYTRLNIIYQGLLRSGTALALYEICRRFATNPSKLTYADTYEHWYNVLTGNAVNSTDLPPYKYFKRDVIKPAVAQINTLTDIEIELIEDKNGTRKVQFLQFKVEHLKQAQLAFPTPPVINLELIERIMKIGFSQQEATNIFAQHPESKLLGVLSFVENRINSKNSPTLDSPVAYFRWALKKGSESVDAHVKNKAKLAAPKTKVEPDVKTLMERFLTARANEAMEVYRELDIDERKDVFERFKLANTGSMINFDKGIESTVVKTMLSMWYAQELWADPSVEDISRFVDNDPSKQTNWE